MQNLENIGVAAVSPARFGKKGPLVGHVFSLSYAV